MARPRKDDLGIVAARRADIGPRQAPRCAAFLLLAVGAGLLQSTGVARAEPPGTPAVVLRADDIGMSHAVNQAVGELLATGLPFSASVMVACPWYLEALEMLRDQPQVSVGIHLTLNSEWQHYKWGPVLGPEAVPTLVDENGHFHASESEFAAAGVDLGEVRRELAAQIERAKRTGARIDYLDYHMLTAVSTPELREIVEDLAAEHGLGLATYFGERSASLWDVAPEKKLRTLLEILPRLEADKTTLLVLHVGLDTPELAALVDLNNPGDPYRVAQHRSAELEAIMSPAFRRAAEMRGIEFVTYRDVIERHGLEAMVRPRAVGYSMEE